MVCKSPRRSKISQQAHAASDASGRSQSLLTGGEKPRIGAAGTNLQADTFRTSRAVPLIGGAIAVHVNPRVHIAAREMDADKLTAIVRTLARILVEGVIDEVEMGTTHEEPPESRE